MFRQCNCNNQYNNSYDDDNDNGYNYNCNDNMYEQGCMTNQMQPDFDNGNSCSCGYESSNVFPNTLLYASSYVPHQYMKKVYTPEMGLKMGTIFPELSNPYCPRSISRNNELFKKFKGF